MARYKEQDVERRLRADAMEIHAEISPQLRSRIDASIRSAGRLRSIPSGPGAARSYWWASGLTGIAAALLVIVLINRDRTGVTDDAPSGEPIAVTVTPEITERFAALPLKTRTADLTGPLEDELDRLQSDLEKVRETVEHDLRSTL